MVIILNSFLTNELTYLKKFLLGEKRKIVSNKLLLNTPLKLSECCLNQNTIK